MELFDVFLSTIVCLNQNLFHAVNVQELVDYHRFLALLAKYIFIVKLCPKLNILTPCILPK